MKTAHTALAPERTTMDQRARWIILTTALAWLVVFAIVPDHAGAQKVTLPPSVVKASPDPAVIASQLRMASDLGRRVLQGLQAAPTDASLPLEALDESVVQGARNTYALIRAAREGLEARRDRQKFPDPLVDLAYKRLTEAWNLSRTPVDMYAWKIERSRYLTMSIRDLTRALQLIEQVQVLLP
jgi:hypothetical protein